jgi:uncharacterized membrane protein YeiH
MPQPQVNQVKLACNFRSQEKEVLSEESFIHAAYIVAISVEAMAAALVAGRREMDWFGVCVIASVTALGGGTLRDVLLGHQPLTWVMHPEYLLIIIIAAMSMAVVAPAMKRLKRIFLMLDAMGLVVFTVIGCKVAISLGLPLSIILISGIITGTFGGVLRDILCNQMPLLFQKELYASVALVTGFLYVGLQSLGVMEVLAMAVACSVGFTFRLLAIHYSWNMPKFVFKEGWE